MIRNRNSVRSLSLATFVAVSAALCGQSPVTITAAPGTVQLAPGLTDAAWLYNGQLPGPVIRVTQGDRVQVRFVNNLPEESTIHFHGVRLPLGMDGVPGVSRPPVEPGQEFTYDFIAQDPGTYFFHPHVGIQIDRGLYGVLIVDPLVPTGPAPDKEFVIVLDDWRSGAPIPGAMPIYSTYLLNGKTSAGQAPFIVDPGDTVRIRVVNASAGTNYAFALDGHTTAITHTDGQPVVPVNIDAVPIGAGERYDFTFTANNPGAWSFAVANNHNRGLIRVRGVVRYRNSTAPDPSPTYLPTKLTTGTLLSYSMLSGAGTPQPLVAVPDRTHNVDLTWGGMMNYAWYINGQQFPNATPLDVVDGENVQFVMRNLTPHDHPMHVHGHFFRLHGTAGGTANPVIKDTILVNRSQMGLVTETADILADNPGKWMFHCHHLYHAEAGMMTTMRYINGDRDGDGLQDGVDMDPLDPFPVLTADPMGGGFTIGTTGSLDLQWPQGTTATFYYGPEVTNPINLGPAGTAYIWPLTLLGSTIAVAGDVASLPALIPNIPALQGTYVTIQAAATHTTGPALRASTALRLRIQ